MTLLTAGMLATASVAVAQGNFYEQVTDLWEAGQKQTVLAIAQQRLQQNPNDIAGLLLQLEYYLDDYDVAHVAPLAARVVEVGQGITTKNFRDRFPVLKFECETAERLLMEIASDPEEFEKGRALKKRQLYMVFDRNIKALQDDGLFNQ